MGGSAPFAFSNRGWFHHTFRRDRPAGILKAGSSSPERRFAPRHSSTDALIPVARYLPPEEFDAIAAVTCNLGFKQVVGPFVRSSYHADEMVRFKRLK